MNQLAVYLLKIPAKPPRFSPRLKPQVLGRGERAFHIEEELCLGVGKTT